jgi:hypothetical protein
LYEIWSVAAVDYSTASSYMENKINEMIGSGNWELHSFNQFLDEREFVVSTLIFKPFY